MSAGKLVFRGVLMMSMGAFLAVGLTGCPSDTRASVPGKVAVLFSGNLATPLAKAHEISNDSLAAAYMTIASIELKLEDGTLVSVLPTPVEVDILLIEGVGELLAAADIPVGIYVGGAVVISSVEVEFLDYPGVLVPVSLLADGEFPVDVQFEVLSGAQGILKVALDNIMILKLDDSSLALEAELHIETDIDDGKQNINDDDSDLVAGNVETDGVIDSLKPEENSFEMEIGDGEVKVDYAEALILLPPVVQGAEPVEGSLADLAENACAHVTGVLTVGSDDMVLIADTVQIVAYNW
ncbi:MAG TPA: hypothetical protein VMZ06_04860 [Candidatus Bathyarchaeia archaeon]|nr:hypothetical protein [Candidatus Bathyarchaeia archaeon]